MREYKRAERARPTLCSTPWALLAGSLHSSRLKPLNRRAPSRVRRRVVSHRKLRARASKAVCTYDSTTSARATGLNRAGFWYANMSVSVSHRPLTFTLGINNVFNSVAANYGYVGLGAFQPENQYGTDKNSFDQASELFGLPYRAFRFVMTFQSGSAPSP
jgi:hypothetical protein